MSNHTATSPMKPTRQLYISKSTYMMRRQWLQRLAEAREKPALDITSEAGTSGKGRFDHRNTPETDN